MNCAGRNCSDVFLQSCGAAVAGSSQSGTGKIFPPASYAFFSATLFSCVFEGILLLVLERPSLMKIEDEKI